MSNKTSSSGGVGLAGLLTVLFVGLKLAGIIDWSWWWVVSPIPIALGLFFLLVIIIASLS